MAPSSLLPFLMTGWRVPVPNRSPCTCQKVRNNIHFLYTLCTILCYNTCRTHNFVELEVAEMQRCTICQRPMRYEYVELPRIGLDGKPEQFRNVKRYECPEGCRGVTLDFSAGRPMSAA